MSYTRDIRRKITVEINGKEKQVEALHEALAGHFSCDWDMEYELTTDEYPYTLIGIEDGVETVYPGCYTLSNGDPGYPDEYEDNLEVCEDDVEQFIDEFAKARSYEFEYYVSSADDYI